MVDFAIESTDTQRSHRGRIERIPARELTSTSPWSASDGLVVGSHRLWVDDCRIPEYTDTSANTTNYSPADYFQVTSA